MTRAEKSAANKAAHENKGRANKGTGKPASGVPANGAGWGGPAQGASSSRIKPRDPDGITLLRHDQDVKARNEARAEEMRELMYRIATDDGEPAMTRLSAADKFLDRVEGKAIARNVTATVDDVSQLTDLELSAEIARLQRELGSGAAGAGEAEAGEQAGGVPPLH